MSRWGEIPLDADTEPGIAAIEREQITKPRPMELDGPLLHQPAKQEHPENEQPIECSFGDSLISHTIALSHHAKKMKVLLSALQQQADNPQKPIEGDDSMPFMPAFSTLENCEAEFGSKNLTLDRCLESNFRRGIGEAPPEINEQLAKKMLRKVVAVVCAHIGFEATTESVLEMLVDLLHEFYRKLTCLLRSAVDRELLVGGTNFPDALEQVFYEVGIGSLVNLCDFYQTRVVDYHKHLLKTCSQLNSEYKRLKNPQEIQNEADDDAVIKEEEIGQIHFPTSDDQDETHHVESLQLDELQSLQATFEQETGNGGTEDDSSKQDQSTKSDFILSLPTANMPNLDPDDEIVNVIDSPVQSHATELIHEPTIFLQDKKEIAGFK